MKLPSVSIIRQFTGLALAVSAAFVLVATPASAALSGDAATAAAANRDTASSVLKQMSDTLGGSEQLNFKVLRQIHPEAAKVLHLPSTSSIDVSVHRPDKVRATTVSDNGASAGVLYSNGRQIALVDSKENLYALVPLAVTIDELPKRLELGYGFAPPLAEFLISDAYSDISRRAASIVYSGTNTINAVACQHLSISGKYAQVDLWIGTSDHLPRRMTARLSGLVGEAYALEFSDWNLAAKHDDSVFAYTPSADAVAIPMLTEAEIAAAKRGK